MKTHELKSWPQYFEPVWLRQKRFELRKDEGREYAAGDILRLREWEPTKGYSGREIKATVTYLLRGPFFMPNHSDQFSGLPSGWVIMSLHEETRVQAEQERLV
jgi:hypothetical protein